MATHPAPDSLSASPEARETVRALRAELPELALSDDPSDRLATSRDLWPRFQLIVRGGKLAPAPPAAVVWPRSIEEVSALVRTASRLGIALVPFGAGSGVCGAIQPSAASVVVDMKRMRKIREIDAARLRVTAEAGIMGQQLEDELCAQEFTLGHFPSSIYCSTLGGWLAGRSAGQCSGRYGKIEDMVLGLRCVDGTGRVLKTTPEDVNHALLPLIVGSEGVLALITDATLRIAVAPKSRRFASFAFQNVESGLEVIREIYQAGLRPAVARLYDPFDTLMARRGGKKNTSDPPPAFDSKIPRGPGMGTVALVRALRFPGALNRLIDSMPNRLLGGAMLVLVWEDDPVIADAERAIATRMVEEGGGKNEGEGPARHWLAHRHAVSYRQSPIYAAGGFVDTMEVAATWSRLLPMYQAVRDALSPHVFVMAHFSHAYPDGASIYFTFAGGSRSDEDCIRVYDAAWAGALAAVLATSGTISHHHGIGRSKAGLLREELGPGLDVLAHLKASLDPTGILNPGALLAAKGSTHDGI